MSKAHSLAGLVGWFMLTFAVAWVGSRFSPGEWYGQLAKPSWTPPDWVFGPVWTLLYTLMAVAAWLVWKRGGLSDASIPLILFVTQLILNGAWSWLFFGLKEPGLAFGEILVLWSAILLTLVAFWKANPAAGMLLLPYLAWSSLAVALNFCIWRMN
ncbi:MAG: tryptophan-rich sensory protein [Candidatus Hydrogenedentota bacterium]|nr:MAG: tryptophan-rich sensory protein [Candidatus Hydrogenedentota bacterium]